MKQMRPELIIGLGVATTGKDY